jgi:hypothetical protein
MSGGPRRETAVRIGCGAGYSGDRIEPAVELAKRGDLDYLVFECLAERTIALAQQRRLQDPRAGYDPLLDERMRATLEPCLARGTRIITNMGAANPIGALARVLETARTIHARPFRAAAIVGDDVLEEIRTGADELLETGRPVRELGERLVSANAYLGAEAIVEALDHGADVIITGRAADPSLFVAAQAHAFGWALDDWPRLGGATVVGHLLECAGQVTGGYFADPDRLPIEGLARLGFPIAEVSSDGSAVITKVAGSGGAVTAATCKAQLLYELHDPAAYLTPDVTADFSGVRVSEREPDRVRVDGATGRPRPARLKVSVGYRDGFIGEGQISYAGMGAVGRARLALAIVRERLERTGVHPEAIRGDLIGLDALWGARGMTMDAEPPEVRLRVAARTASRRDAECIGREVEALYTNGPAGGGGAAASVREVLAIGTTFIDRGRVRTRVEYGAVS